MSHHQTKFKKIQLLASQPNDSVRPSITFRQDLHTDARHVERAIFSSSQRDVQRVFDGFEHNYG